MLKVNEIFMSIQGESSCAGLPCVFIRLTGCNLRCAYCDTTYAYEEGTFWLVRDIVKAVSIHEIQLVEITGGEPLEQEETPQLAGALLDSGFAVLVETNGTRDISLLPAGVIRIMDIKCPGSGEHEKTDWNNLGRLQPNDEVKFVLCGEADYLWAREIVKKYGLAGRAKVLFSPAKVRLDPRASAFPAAFRGKNKRIQKPSSLQIEDSPQQAAGSFNPADLAAWILRDRLPVRLQLQIQKILWPDSDRAK
ncbi:radical SAM protein [bacterium]|nr:radical SAM protein [bacterium]